MALKSISYVTSDKRVAPENRHWLPLRPFPFPLPLPLLPEAAPPLPFPCPFRLDRGPRSGYIWIPFGGSCILEATKRAQLPSCLILSKCNLVGSPLLSMSAIAPDLSLRTYSRCAVISMSRTRCSRSVCGRAPFCYWTAFSLFVPVLQGQLAVAGTIGRLLPKLVRFPL